MMRGPADGDRHRRTIDAVLGEAKIVAAIHGMLLLRHVELAEMAAVGTPLSCRSDHPCADVADHDEPVRARC